MGQITVEKMSQPLKIVLGDNRGYFMETYSQCDMEENGIHINFVQDNQRMSVRGILRGCISRRTSLRLSWFGSSKAVYLMWQ